VPNNLARLAPFVSLCRLSCLLSLCFVLRPRPAVRLVALFKSSSPKSPSTLLPCGPSWISTRFLFAKSSKWHLSTPLVEHLSVINPCVSVVQRSSVVRPNNLQSALPCVVLQVPLLLHGIGNSHHCFAMLIASSKCRCRSLVLIAFHLSSSPPHGCHTLREPVTRALTIVRSSGFVHTCHLP